MRWFINLFRSIARFFRTKAGFASFQKILPYIKAALPYIDAAAAIASGRQSAPDVISRLLNEKFPNLAPFKVPRTEDETKLLALAIATELMRLDYRNLTTNEIRKTLELAYADWKAIQEGRAQ